MRRKTAAAFFVVACASLPAQWINYPTPGVPRKADGSPDLNAPAPKTPDGKPDLSGIWLLEHNKPCPKDGCNDMEISQEFNDIGWSLKDGAPYQPWARDLVKARLATNSMDDPGSKCLPAGILKQFINPFYRKFIPLPGLLVILTERDAQYRQIFTDGRPLPSDPVPTPNGYSTGHWEGDALVVETIGFPEGQWLDRNGSPLTSGAKITERFHRVNYGRMEVQFTIDDPKAYTRPFTIQVNQFIAVNTELMDFFCMENEKDVPHTVGK